ncbi:hypothetical protein ACIXUF_11980 [Bacteroides fragilis]
MKTKFVKETDRKGTYIIEGSFDGTFFNIKRFICQVQEQETEKETQELADFILSNLIPNCIDMNEIEWKSVPGYSNYQLNISTLSVRNLSTNKNLVLRKGMVQLIGKNGNISINIPRLLFCVSKGVDPRRVPRNIIVVLENGHPVAYDRSSYMSGKIKSVYHEKTNQNPLESYTNARNFIDNIISAMESGDYTTVVKSLYGYRDKLIGRIMKNGVMRNENEAIELASAAIARTVSNIVSGVLVFFPFQYMYGVAKGISMDVHRAEK